MSTTTQTPATDPRQGAADGVLYYIQYLGTVVGNSAMWWRPGGCGYTCDLSRAGRYVRAEAENLERLRRRSDKAWPVALVDQIAERHVDVHRLQSIRDVQVDQPPPPDIDTVTRGGEEIIGVIIWADVPDDWQAVKMARAHADGDELCQCEADDDLDAWDRSWWSATVERGLFRKNYDVENGDCEWRLERGGHPDAILATRVHI